jgi:site-specific DNA recombinase
MKKPPAHTVRCAVYTRKSTEEGLDQDFNSLDAQRESGRAYIKSQKAEGWMCLPRHYDDGGFTGGNMERPALHRLLADITQGQVDCVVVYKVDRLSRSLLDFARIMETFEKHQVAFVSVTQQFNTATSMGRLILNVLLSFAQFEREMISERTRDKIAAARRKGKWVGGQPILGYNVDHSKLVVHEEEAKRVRAIFALYLERGGLLRVVEELERRGWLSKSWQTRKGHWRGGRPFTKTSLHHLLTNVLYVGKIRYKKEVHPAEHPAIVDREVWEQVQEMLRQKDPAKGSPVRNPSQALLKGLLHCRSCGCAMTPTESCKNGSRRYRYYVCQNALKRGVCPARSVPAGAIEPFVIGQLQGLAKDSKWEVDLDSWDSLPAEEQIRLLQRLVQRVDYDGAKGKVTITFQGENGRPTKEKHP